MSNKISKATDESNHLYRILVLVVFVYKFVHT